MTTLKELSNVDSMMISNPQFRDVVRIMVDFEIQLEIDLSLALGKRRCIYVGGMEAVRLLRSSIHHLDAFGNSTLRVFEGVHPSYHLLTGIRVRDHLL